MSRRGLRFWVSRLALGTQRGLLSPASRFVSIPNQQVHLQINMSTAAVQQKVALSPAHECLPFSPWPCFAGDEIEAVTSVLRSGKVNYWTGEEGRQFEAEFASHVGTKYGVCVANGTLALELALHALGIGAG